MIRAVTRHLPLTQRGLSLLLASLVMLTVGVLRRDLAALFWGGGFLLLILYAAVGSGVARALISRRLVPESVDLKLPSRGVFPGDLAEALLRAELPRLRIPGFDCLFVTELRWKTRTPVRLAAEVGFRPYRGTIAFRMEQRGKFACFRPGLEVRDLLGFTSGRIDLDLRETLTVYPRVDREDPAPLRVRGGTSAEDTARREKRKDLLEVRRYFPGDDTRRLNWKVFAHTGQLLLREGEQAPPPSSNLLCVLDATRSETLTRALADRYLDRLVEAAASLVLGALRGGSSILLSAGGLSEVISVHGEGRRRLLSTLATIWWEAPDRLPPVPADRQTAGRNTCVLLFSSPGSHGLDPLLRAMRGRGWRITVVLSDITAPAAPAAPFAALSRAQAESFRALLDAGVVRAKSCLGEAGDVRVV